MPVGAKLAELAQEAARESAELGELRTVLEGIVVAKRAGVANPEAWSRAFAIVDSWEAAEAEEDAPTTVVCPDCDQILPNVGTEGKPRRIDCGPEHALHYRSFSATIGADRQVTIRAHKVGSTPGEFATIPLDLDELDDEGETRSDG